MESKRGVDLVEFFAFICKYLSVFLVILACQVANLTAGDVVSVFQATLKPQNIGCWPQRLNRWQQLMNSQIRWSNGIWNTFSCLSRIRTSDSYCNVNKQSDNHAHSTQWLTMCVCLLYWWRVNGMQQTASGWTWTRAAAVRTRHVVCALPAVLPGVLINHFSRVQHHTCLLRRGCVKVCTLNNHFHDSSGLALVYDGRLFPTVFESLSFRSANNTSACWRGQSTPRP